MAEVRLIDHFNVADLPLLRSSVAVDLPIPELAPVTMTVFPSSLSFPSYTDEPNENLALQKKKKKVFSIFKLL